MYSITTFDLCYESAEILYIVTTGQTPSLPNCRVLRSRMKPLAPIQSCTAKSVGGNQKFNTLVDVVLEQLAVGRLVTWLCISINTT